jgi:hypothetical protein
VADEVPHIVQSAWLQARYVPAQSASLFSRQNTAQPHESTVDSPAG